ncbi:hypothetical protein FRX31_031910, partial [Thalictrum thalictroides]
MGAPEEDEVTFCEEDTGRGGGNVMEKPGGSGPGGGICQTPGYADQGGEQMSQSNEITSEMHNSSDQQSPSYHAFYAPSSPPWLPFPIVSPITHSGPTSVSFASAEVSSALNAAAGERSSGPPSDLFHLLTESETVGSVSTCLPLQSTVAPSPCEPHSCSVQEPQQ